MLEDPGHGRTGQLMLSFSERLQNLFLHNEHLSPWSSGEIETNVWFQLSGEGFWEELLHAQELGHLQKEKEPGDIPTAGNKSNRVASMNKMGGADMPAGCCREESVR